MDPLIIPIAGMAIPTIIVPAVLGMRYARRERELEHVERMRALELGRTLPQDESWWTPNRLALVIGAVVPLGVFACAALATFVADFHPGVWIAAGVVGASAVFCGSSLAGRHASVLGDADRFAKVPIGEDAFDVVGARG